MIVRDVFNNKKTEGDVGIEIEVEGRRLPNPDNISRSFAKYWKIEHDGSLKGEESFEYVLRRPIKHQDVMLSLNELENAYKDCTSMVDDSVRAGIHVHVNVQELEIVQLCTLVTLYYVLENTLTKFCGKGRQGNHFCLRSSDAEFQIQNITKGIQRRDFSYWNDQNIRYSAQNLNSLAKYGSLEYRAFRSTKDMNRIKVWCDLLMKMKESSLKFANPTDVILSFSENDDKFNFLRVIFGDLADHLEPFYNQQDLLEGIHYAQDIAFCSDWVFDDRDIEQKMPKGKVKIRWDEPPQVGNIHDLEFNEVIDEEE